MAGDSSSDYARGDMPIKAQSTTFSGFNSISRYSGVVIILVVFWSTMLFAVGINGAAAAISTLVLGLVLGMALKLRGAYYPLLIVVCLLLGLGTAIFS